MTALSIPNKYVEREAGTGKTIAVIAACGLGHNGKHQDVSAIGAFRLGFTYYPNVLNDDGHRTWEQAEGTWTREIGDYYNQYGKMVLSHDKKICYVCTDNYHAQFVPAVYRIDLATRTITHTFSYDGLASIFRAIAIDSVGNIFVGGNGTTGSDTGMELIKLNGDDLSEIWKITRPFVNWITVDANDNIYVACQYVHASYTKNVYHYNGSTGSLRWADGINTAIADGGANPKTAYQIVIDSTGRVFVFAEGKEAQAGENGLFEIDSNADNDGAILQSGDIGRTDGLTAQEAYCQYMVVLSSDNLLTYCEDNIREWTTTGSFTEVTSGNFPINDEDIYWIKGGPMGLLYVSSASGAGGTIKHYKQDGTHIKDITRWGGLYDAVFPQVRSAQFMRMSMSPETLPTAPANSLDLTEHEYDDMPCFLAPTTVIPLYDGDAGYAVDDIFYWRGDDYQDMFIDPLQTGVFKVLETIDDPSPGHNCLWEIWDKIERISPAITADHTDWNQYPGFGGYAGSGDLVVGGEHTGIGASPKFYTASLYGLLDENGDPSPYNGDYILRKGPGLFGFFYHYNQTTGFHLLFNIGRMAMNNHAPDDNISTRIRAFLEPSILGTEYPILDLIDGGAGVDQIVIDGDLTALFVTDTTCRIAGSSAPRNDGDYVVADSSTETGLTLIDIPTGSLTNDTATGGTVRIVYGGPTAEMIYKYSVDVDVDTQLIHPDNKANEYSATTFVVIAKNGVCSLYPGIIDQWDAETTYAASAIAVWHGRFYQADNENTGSEPPSGDWTAI